MNDVTFKNARVILAASIANYSAQDLETQLIGLLVPFTYDFQNGDTFLGFDLVNDLVSNDYGYDDFEAFGLAPSLPLVQYLGVNVNSYGDPTTPLKTAVITPAVLNFADDDMESYPAGGSIAITLLNNSFSGGGATFGLGLIRPFA